MHAYTFPVYCNAEKITMTTEVSNDGMDIVNHMDIKVHGIQNVPPSWWSDGKHPTYPEHPFRYEVSFTIDGNQTFTLANGRLLQYLPQYRDYIENAALPPLSSTAKDVLRQMHEVPEAPTKGKSISTTKTTGNSQAVEDDAQPEARIIWITPPTSERAPTPSEELLGKRRKKTAGNSVGEDLTPVAVPEDDDTPPCMIRMPLDERHIMALESMMLSGRPLELKFTRVLRPGLPTEWEDKQEWYFRAIIPVDLAPLSDPGSRELSADIQLQPVKAAVRTEEVKKTSKRSKNMSQGLRHEEIDTEGEHPYVTCKTSAVVSIELEKTLVQLPKDRIRPAVLPTNLIPKRPPPRKEFRDSTRQFSDMVASIAERMMHDCAALQDADSERKEEEILEVFENSGRLESYKEQLLPLVVNVVREKFLSDKDASPDVISRLTNELYVHLLNSIHCTLHNMVEGMSTPEQENANRVATAKPSTASPQGPDDGIDYVWLERAEEAETIRDYARATRCHQARIASCACAESFPDVWYDAASYFVRIGETTRAEQCFREAISHDPTHAPSLMAYGALLLTFDRFDEATVYLQAAVDAKPSSLSWGLISLLCDMHVLNLERGPRYESQRAHWEHEGTIAMREALSFSTDVDHTSVSKEVADYLLKLQHPGLANISLTRCSRGGHTEVLYARLFALGEQYNEALETLKNGEGLEPYIEEVTILRGDCYAALGRSDEAIREYKSVLCAKDKEPRRRFGPSYIHLGNLLITAGCYNDALGAFTIGIQAWPCSLTWLGAGIAYYRLNKIDAAEECLSESNTLNNTNPRTWAYLSLVCLRKERVELKTVLRQAIMQGLADPGLLTELGRDLVRACMGELGESCLRKALAVERECGREDSAVCCTAMYYLAGAVEGNNAEEAWMLYTAVANKTMDEVLRAKAEEQLAALGKS
ncbi:hypothetical protein, conserved [Trypanosoma brucei gambiense DAL972]|uniref:Tetratricopeptide repeat protein n=1 Tax=Trypanosoma brucei gambiense (strain MHOM/CI/86/DAL972) TaxID=679716 RepID=D0A1R1_TRYB9|nr:hypothetical protein, conserved [Trypanosoma brucei gambiense DAL972]CBH15204.1 hypothetical protein, conserved [Trypanosoma brucei gambiense DAL972]|eukprot:XP_011777469.1 hypothetical protein, conserved [Trypanosoma brucei gambiense DAL972]